MILVLNKNNLKMFSGMWYAAVGNNEADKLIEAKNKKKDQIVNMEAENKKILDL